MMKNIKLKISLLLMFAIGSTAVYAQDNGITDYVESRDLTTVKSMFSNNWQWLGMNSAQDTDFINDMTNWEDGKFKVLRINGQTIGFIGYYYDAAYCDGEYQGDDEFGSTDVFEGRIWYLVVDNSYHHKGCGDQLMSFAINDMRAHGVTEVTLCTCKDNAAARRLYENRFGFEVAEEKYIELILHLA